MMSPTLFDNLNLSSRSKSGTSGENAATAERARIQNEENNSEGKGSPKDEGSCFEEIKPGSGQRLGKEGSCDITSIIDIADLRKRGIRIGVQQDEVSGAVGAIVVGQDIPPSCVKAVT